MLDTVKGYGAGTAHHPDHFVSFLQQALGQVGTVLAGHTGDQCNGHDKLSYFKIQTLNYIAACSMSSSNADLFRNSLPNGKE
jgi:hypothetical protein